MMELNELKKIWQYSESVKDSKSELEASNISYLLQCRSKSILSRLDRSVKIGICFLVAFFLITLADLLLPTELLFSDNLIESFEVPKWINLMEWCVNLILMVSILHFIVKYHNLKVNSLANEDLQGALKKVLKLLNTFRKEFYVAVIVLDFGIGLAFLSEAYNRFKSISSHQMPTKLSIVIIAGSLLLICCLLIASIFFVLQKGFNSLFGKYQEQLIQSLDELREK